MKIEKKTIALCIIALLVGIALVLPIAYDRGVQTRPLFNIGILHATATDNTVSAIINITTTSEAAKLKDRDVRMEIYNFHFYSDQESIANVTYTIDMSALTAEDLSNGLNVVTIGSHLPGSIAIADGSGTLIDYGTIISQTAGIGGYTFQRGEKSHVMGVGAYLYRPITVTIMANSTEGILAEEIFTEGILTVPGYSFQAGSVSNAQSLYVEVVRIMSVSYQRPLSDASTTSPTTTVLTNNEVVAHIELVKVDCEFVYGNYEQIVEATGNEVIINYNSQPILTVYYHMPTDGTKPADNSEDD